MRILLINPNTSASVTESVTGHARRIAGEAAEFVPVTARFGARYISSRAALAIAGHAALDCLAEHADGQAEGYDAVYLACFGDPGLSALQEVSRVPVVGMVEASCRVAAERAGRFGIVTGGALWEPILREMVGTLGHADQFAGVRTITRTGGEIARDPAAALADLAAACRACAAQDGAEAVILGGAALAGLVERIQPDIPVPVICSVEAGTRGVVAAASRGRRPSGRVDVESTGLAPALSRMLAGG
jgi:Asp/Glu/hydantoin racemase